MTAITVLLCIAATGFGIARRFQIPVIPFLIFGGLSVSTWLPQENALDLQKALELGLTFLVFASGIELNPQRFGHHKKAVIWVGVLQFAAAASIGFLTARALGFGTKPALYLAFAISTSSTLVVVRLLSQGRQMAEPFGRLVVGVLLFQDVLMILLIIVFARLPEGGLAVLKGIGGTMGLAGLALASQRWFVSWLIIRRKRESELLLSMILAQLFVFTGLAHALNLPTVAGAFAAGLALSSFPVNGVVRALLSSLNDFFLAIFFTALGAFVGIPDDPTILLKGILLGLTLISITPPIVALVAERFGLSSRNAIEAGILLAQSSEFSLVLGITGHITAQGGQHRGDEACPDECHGNGWSTGGNSAGQDCATCECTPRCAPDDNTHAVRCCADADPTEAKAKCEAYVGYKGQLKNPPPASNTMDEIGREATTTAASALCQSSSSCYELQGLFGGWPVGATSDQIRAGQVTNAAGGYTHGGSQGYSTSGFNGNNNHLERHESGVCGESDNGLGEADEQGKRTNQCFGGEGGASNRAHLFRFVSRATLTLWCAVQAARSPPCPSPLATAIIGARGLPAPRTNTTSAAGGMRSRSASPSDPGCARSRSCSRRTRATPAATTTARWSGPRRRARPAARTNTSWPRAA